LEQWWSAGRILTKADGTPRLDGLKIYLKDLRGPKNQSIWADIPRVANTSGERLDYDTQKPLVLLERIIEASSNKSEIVLDPFCGCGTAIEAAHKLGRKWIGIDVTYLAIHVVEERLVKAFGDKIKNTYALFGSPCDPNDAIALAGRNWLEFQKWAVFMLGGLPKEKPGPDGGIDGIIRYHRVGTEQPNRAVVSVTGSMNVGVNVIHKLKSVVKREDAELGILVCLESPTGPMVREAVSEGDVGPPSRRVPKLQIVTVDALFQPHPIELPGMLDPPELIRVSPAIPRLRGRRRRVAEGQTELLLPIPGDQTALAQRRRGRSIRQVQIEVTRPEFQRKG
jgi:hypothetical protein